MYCIEQINFCGKYAECVALIELYNENWSIVPIE